MMLRFTSAIVAVTLKVIPSYQQDIKPIFMEKCANCHNSLTGLADWTNYETAYNGRSKIYKRVVIDKNMPLNGSLTEKERKLIADWVNTGAER